MFCLDSTIEELRLLLVLLLHLMLKEQVLFLQVLVLLLHHLELLNLRLLILVLVLQIVYLAVQLLDLVLLVLDHQLVLVNFFVQLLNLNQLSIVVLKLLLELLLHIHSLCRQF